MVYISHSVEVRGLRKVFKNGVVAVENLSFNVGRGEIYGLIGPNGSGKTTTLRIIATLLKPTSGNVIVEGVDVVKQPLEARKLIGYLPEEAGAYRDLTGFDFIKLMLSIRFHGPQLEARVDEAVSISGLEDFVEKPIKTYSKGMKRILALSVVLAQHPRVLVLDEPTSGLDVEKSMFVRDLIRKYRLREGVAVIVSSHNMLEVETLCDRVGVLYKGRLIVEGEPGYLKKAFSASNLEEVFLRTVGSHVL